MTVAELIEQLKQLPQYAVVAHHENGMLRRTRYALQGVAHEYKAYDGWQITPAVQYGKPRTLRKGHPPFTHEYAGTSEDDREITIVTIG